jgi:exodeoxyribonuclease VII small subunit
MPEPMTEKTEAYDVLVTRLERIVNELESGDLTLEQSIEKFGEGIRLAQDAGRKLDEAERRIEMLVRSADGSQETVAFDPGKGKGQESDAG